MCYGLNFAPMNKEILRHCNKIVPNCEVSNSYAPPYFIKLLVSNGIFLQRNLAQVKLKTFNHLYGRSFVKIIILCKMPLWYANVAINLIVQGVSRHRLERTVWYLLSRKWIN